MRLQEMIDRIRRIPFVRNSTALGCSVVTQTLGRGNDAEMHNTLADATSRRVVKCIVIYVNTAVLCTVTCGESSMQTSQVTSRLSTSPASEGNQTS